MDSGYKIETETSLCSQISDPASSRVVSAFPLNSAIANRIGRQLAHRPTRGMEARNAERAARVSAPDASCGSRKKPASAAKKIWFPGAHTCLPPAMRASLSSLISRWVFANRSHSGDADRCSWPLSSTAISSWHLAISPNRTPEITADLRG